MTARAGTIERVREELDELRIIIPDTIDELFEQAGFDQIYVGLIGTKNEVLRKTLSPLTRMPDVRWDTFEFTVQFAGPFPAISYVTLMEGDSINRDFVFRPKQVGREFLKGETYVLTLRLLPPGGRR
jgi:hypothetical protein